MKFNPKHQKQFRKDYKKCEKRGYDMSLLHDIMTKLENGELLDPIINRPHFLSETNPEMPY